MNCDKLPKFGCFLLGVQSNRPAAWLSSPDHSVGQDRALSSLCFPRLPPHKHGPARSYLAVRLGLIFLSADGALSPNGRAFAERNRLHRAPSQSIVSSALDPRLP